MTDCSRWTTVYDCLYAACEWYEKTNECLTKAEYAERVAAWYRNFWGAWWFWCVMVIIFFCVLVACCWICAAPTKKSKSRVLQEELATAAALQQSGSRPSTTPAAAAVIQVYPPTGTGGLPRPVYGNPPYQAAPPYVIDAKRIVPITITPIQPGGSNAPVSYIPVYPGMMMQQQQQPAQAPTASGQEVLAQSPPNGSPTEEDRRPAVVGQGAQPQVPLSDGVVVAPQPQPQAELSPRQPVADQGPPPAHQVELDAERQRVRELQDRVRWLGDALRFKENKDQDGAPTTKE